MISRVINTMLNSMINTMLNRMLNTMLNSMINTMLNRMLNMASQVNEGDITLPQLLLFYNQEPHFSPDTCLF